MQGLYLLGFVRDCFQVPGIGGISVGLTRSGRHGVMWCQALPDSFPGKQEFLAAMLSWLQEIAACQITMLPVQSGIRVRQESDLLNLLRHYESILEQGFNRISGCREYDLNISVTSDDHIRRPRQLKPDFEPRPARSITGGQEYLSQLRARQKERKRRQERATAVGGFYASRLAPYYREYRVNDQTSGGERLELAFLVPAEDEREFCRVLEQVLDDEREYVDWSGPWPPFHFSSFSLQPEDFLVRESFQWEKGGER